MIMTEKAMVTLAGILFLQPPGQSIHSRTNIDYCDEKCQQTPVCKDPSLLCEAPKFNQDIFAQKLDPAQKSLLTADQWAAYERQMKFSSFTYAETYEEGVARYAVIAEAVKKVSEDLSWYNINDRCKQECKNAPNSKDCKQCQSARPWTGTQIDLQHAILTVFHHESGFRQDVHAGDAPLGRGDCQWIDSKTRKKAAPFAKGASPVQGTCRSVCLGQINIGPDEKFGYKAADLVGTDLESTMRCAEVTGRILAQSRNRCSRLEGTDAPTAMFSAYGTGGNCFAKEGTGASLRPARWATVRANTYRRLKAAPTEVNERAKRALGIEAEETGPVALSD